MNAKNRLTLNVSRDSVCAGDDIDAPHSMQLSVGADETLAKLLSRIVGMPYLASIFGGKATWIVESAIPLAVVAQQWDRPAYLVDPAVRIVDCVSFDIPRPLFFRYWCRVDPAVVLACLKAGRPLPDKYSGLEASSLSLARNRTRRSTRQPSTVERDRKRVPKVFKIGQPSDSGGTSFLGETKLPPAFLMMRFGKHDGGDGIRSSGGWTFVGDAGEVFTVYEWRSTTLSNGRESGSPTIREFWSSWSGAKLHIGGFPNSDWVAFRRWLQAQYREFRKGQES